MTPNRRWTIFFVLSLIYILVYFYRVSLAVVAGDISRELSLSPADLGRLSGILFYVYAVAQLPLGPLIDRFGGRLVISGCGVLTTIGGALFAAAASLEAAMIARVLIGIGTASVLMATFTIFSHWFSKQEFGRVSGFMVAVGNLGNVLGTVPLALAVSAIGWRSSFVVIAVLQGLVTLLVYGMVRDRPPAAAEAAGKAEEETVGIIAAWKEIFSRSDFLLLGVLAFFWYGSYLAVQGLWGGPYLMEVLHLSRTATGQMLMYTSIGFICGSLIVDYLARKVFRSYKKTLLAGQVVLLLFMSGFLGWGERLAAGVLVGWFFCIGIAVSSGIMIYPLIRNMFRVRIVGTALTSLNFFVLMGAAVTQHLMGIIIEQMGAGGMTARAFHAAFLLPMIGLAAAILLYLPVKESR
ncbi:MAG: major facilitator superfamily 1 [Deltaproteobacteria bacterium]|nr:major facilitator superfamily 1 [Deltaproteobacteria bacterium]